MLARHVSNPMIFENYFAPNFDTFSKALPAFLGLQLALIDSSLRSILHTGCTDYNNCDACTECSLRRTSTVSSAVSSADLFSAHSTVIYATAIAQE